MKPKIARGKIAITVWEHRVSPVFDSARTLLIADIKDDTLICTSYLTFDPDRPLELLQMLQAQKVLVIICGAVSEGPANLLEGAGFELIPFIAGDVHQVLATFLQGDPLGLEFKMPGCGRQICCRGKIRRGKEIGALKDNNRRVRGRPRQAPAAVAQPEDEHQDGAASTAISEGLSAKL